MKSKDGDNSKSEARDSGNDNKSKGQKRSSERGSATVMQSWK